MADEPAGTIVRLDDTALTVADPADEVRGKKAVDSNGEEIGDVDGLMIDESERRVRFLEVGSGGFLGLGEKKRLVPVEAVTRIEGDTIHIGRERMHVAGAPEYDPEVLPASRYHEDQYPPWRRRAMPTRPDAEHDDVVEHHHHASRADGAADGVRTEEVHLEGPGRGVQQACVGATRSARQAVEDANEPE